MTVITTWNPNDKNADIALSNGNLTAQQVANDFTVYKLVRATHSLYRSGKGYFELVVGTGNLDRWSGGVATLGEPLSERLGYTLSGWGYQAQYSTYYGMRYHSTYAQWGLAIPNGGIFQCAVDADNGKIWFGGNGVWFNSGDPETGVNPAYSDVFGAVYPAFSTYRTNNVAIARFSSSSFSYSPPVGFSAWDDVAGDHLPGSRVTNKLLRRDMEDGGLLSIIEPVTRLNTIPPQSRRVRLCDQRNGRLVREQWSDPVTGLVTFEHLREGPWVLYSLDHTGEFEAVAISDRVATVDGARP